MGKFRGHVIVTTAEATGDALDPATYDRLLEHAQADHIERRWVACDCVGAVAQEAAAEVARKTFGSGSRDRWTAFVAAHPELASAPYNDKWQTERTVPYAAARAAFLAEIDAFKRRTFDAHPERTAPDPSHQRCGGTGRYFVEGQDEHEGLFTHVSERILDRGRVGDLLGAPPFALFLPDGTGAVSDIPETWDAFGPTWDTAARALLAPHRELAFVELEFGC